MKYAVVFVLAGIGCVALASTVGGVASLLYWVAVDLFLLAYAYAANRARLIGKTDHGTIGLGRFAIFAPYLLLTWFCWALYVRLSREDWSNEVADGIWVGRRPAPHHLPEGALVVDMTAEFITHSELRSREGLVLIPTLDARSPGANVLLEHARRLASHEGRVYIHCAQGHGRSATLAALILAIRDGGASIDEAMRAMSLRRPAVHLHTVQRRDATAALCEYRRTLEGAL